jgi:hypothetical protein
MEDSSVLIGAVDRVKYNIMRIIISWSEEE